ncbi:hypothetical protein [Natronoglycomyces albus]|uniref:Uncharacterized protein n=1 Tax=Natronoglycomyces albus TaxID=2811108 RepID=A0A895XRF4_9ACTN|nr:hypothetical protein [Natronoglycomyces albus]QSB06292.1 hypothetical protein JQS30_05125 [Natronoglycomyces albus]
MHQDPHHDPNHGHVPSPPHDSYPGMAPRPTPVDPVGPQDSYPGMAPGPAPVDPTGSLSASALNPGTPPPVPNYGPPPVTPQKGSSTGTVIAVVLLLIIVIGGGGAGIWWYTSGDDESAPVIAEEGNGANDADESEPEADGGFPMDARTVHAEDWYHSDWHFTLTIDGEERKAHLIYVDRWDHADCSNVLEETQNPDLLVGNECLYGLEGHYERPDAGFEVCQRVFEFRTAEGAARAEAGIDFDPDDIFYAPVTCTRPLHEEVAWDTRITAHGRFLTVTVGAFTQEGPSSEDIQEFVSAVGYRHTEISNATMWLG